MSKVKTPKSELAQLAEEGVSALRRGGRGGGEPVYTPELEEEILDRVSNGESLSSVCRDKEVSRQAVYLWAKHSPEFALRLARARLWAADSHVDDMKDTAFDERTSPADRRVKLHALEQSAKLLAPRRYGTQYTESTHEHRQAEVDREAILLAAKVLSEDIVEAEYTEIEAGPPPPE